MKLYYIYGSLGIKLTVASDSIRIKFKYNSRCQTFYGSPFWLSKRNSDTTTYTHIYSMFKFVNIYDSVVTNGIYKEYDSVFTSPKINGNFYYFIKAARNTIGGIAYFSFRDLEIYKK